MRVSLAATISSVLLAGLLDSAQAQSFLGGDQGKLLLTAGFSTIEGSGGGAVTPWALIGGYGTSSSFGANVYGTGIALGDLQLRSFGAAVGVWDRVEISYARQELEFTDGAFDNLEAAQDIVGVKVRVLGDAVYDQQSWVPQVAAGAQFKRNRGIEGATAFPSLNSVRQLGADDTQSVDFYASATKLYLAHSFLLNATVRATEANQGGLLGFGGDRDDGYSLQAEGTFAYLLSRKWALGAEFRTRPRNLAADNERAAWDVFAAWTPAKYVSVVAAYVNIGEVLSPLAASSDQQGGYLSVQVGF
jgi:hypothetical protein